MDRTYREARTPVGPVSVTLGLSIKQGRSVVTGPFGSVFGRFVQNIFGFVYGNNV